MRWCMHTSIRLALGGLLDTSWMYLMYGAGFILRGGSVPVQEMPGAGCQICAFAALSWAGYVGYVVPFTSRAKRH